MKIDHNYLKKLLEACQASEKPTFDIEDLKAAGFDYNDLDFEFHMAILADKRFIQQDDCDGGFGLTRSVDGFLSWSALLLRLTASGHDFLDTVQNPEVGSKTKAAAKKVGGVGFDLFLQIAEAEAKRFAVANLGLPFYEVIQHEPGDAFDPEIVGLFASIGIKKGKPFAPDDRMKSILTDAIGVANATARAIVFAPRDDRVKFYSDRQWATAFIRGSYAFYDKGERMLDARTLFHYYATGITPAMANSTPGTGSAYAYATRDSKGEYLDGAKTYKITLPAPIPAKQFWSFMVYDGQTRSMLETDQKLAGLDSNDKNIKSNPNGSVTVWFAPEPPAGQETNWVQTIPGKGWNTLLRLYGPLEPWFDKTWKPGDFELVN
ncbi:MAG: DUF1214 domain-containing protein [Methylocella sp.]